MADGSEQALLQFGGLIRRAKVSPDGRALYQIGGREADAFYRDRWSYDKVVRSTHGVNCTGSCSWKVYVRDGIITWEQQQTDYPTAGPDRPEYEPRGCPRGAAFSWYTYSPTRVRYPYARGVLIEMFREARQRLGDPVAAWAEIQNDPAKRRAYQRARGQGGLVRVNWDEALEMAAAAHVHAIKEYGPDRIAGFSPIPAMSMVSHAVGARFMSLIGATMLSFYDWYADLPVASPQVFGDQTDVPESGDWWDASYLLMWGSNIPVTRTPDAHWMAEARYRGQKVVVVSPDFADNVKFADEWMPAQPGTDGALAMAMGHVILKEFFVDRRTPPFVDYVRRYTDLPYLITLRRRPDGAYQPDRFYGDDFKPVVWDSATGAPAVPRGSLGHRFGDEPGRWNLDLGDIEPALTCLGAGQAVEILLPRFDLDEPGTVRRSVPTRMIDGQLVTSVFDLMLAQYGVSRPGLPGQWPTGYDDPDEPYTPAWQEPITGVPAAQVARVAREFADNAERSGGRSMILLGAGVNQWFHGDTTYRAILALVTLTGCQGVNGGGWAHYVGQEKCRPVTGWQQLAFALDWVRPPRQMIGTAYWYTHTDQWRYDTYTADAIASPTGTGQFAGRHTMDLLAQSARLGWMPSMPTFDRNPLDLADEAGDDPGSHVAGELHSGRLGFACADPDDPKNWPRVFTAWRANILGSSAKGNEYFLKHLLGTRSNLRAADVSGKGEAPEGKLDLMLSLDFRMTSTTLLSDIVLPAATWYEKHDLNTTDMHPFIHAFTPAISPPWQTRTDFDIFHGLARHFSALAKTHLGVRKDLVAAPLLHDTPDAMATPCGRVVDWQETGEVPVPGRTMPKIVVVERDYGAVADRLGALGPLLDTLGTTVKGVHVDVNPEIEYLRRKNGVVLGDRPSLLKDVHACEAILALSGTTNGRVATEGFHDVEKRTGVRLADLAAEHEGKQITFADCQARPVPVITSPEWSGSETGGRRYSPFTINVERLKPWHTLTGRQHFFLDHDWMHEAGEALPIFRPPLDMHKLFGEPRLGRNGELEITLRYLTPHSKWSIHSEYQDNLIMLTLSRGGPTMWMSEADAAKIKVRDNEWIEAVNRNGVVVCRAVVTHKMPEGTVYFYHAQERVIDVPKAEINGRRGGIHNSLTRLLVKPTHIIGGYAQLSFAFNYLGPTGNQRDEVTVIRRRSQDVEY
ncbi:nitrate reductase alpha subunit [Actinoplanes campanulatus]|uniref:nitrate reductase (quinone) n=1 Tax=Actinoplanes campanulatus TaxID=113559 RepID=A0A7W5AFX8_9ACTN|nr:nitrate reductase subunit alpha [Actinoplanes campanulatus]MBB3095493.1 nitrate reductase alpha subunit [Actinoplanes campanulatus]GGN09406.1 nitrate reductase subunit alpha [Actinoplanes campanulatus]GID36384.1 nitrate reductase subunit alpha [Actinoplanes campanulatus]